MVKWFAMAALLVLAGCATDGESSTTTTSTFTTETKTVEPFDFEEAVELLRPTAVSRAFGISIPEGTTGYARLQLIPDPLLIRGAGNICYHLEGNGVDFAGGSCGMGNVGLTVSPGGLLGGPIPILDETLPPGDYSFTWRNGEPDSAVVVAKYGYA